VAQPAEDGSGDWEALMSSLLLLVVALLLLPPQPAARNTAAATIRAVDAVVTRRFM
jgi:hypothetical protein